MRLRDDALAGEIVALGPEREAIDLAPQTRERDRKADGLRIDRLAVARGIDAELRVLAVFEDGHLDGEIAVREQAAAMRAPGRFGGFAFAMFVGRFGALAACRERERKQDCRGNRAARDEGTDHCEISAELRLPNRPVRRSICAKAARSVARASR